MLSIGDLSSSLFFQALNDLRSERLFFVLPGCAVRPAEGIVFSHAVCVSALVVASCSRELAHPMRVYSFACLCALCLNLLWNYNSAVPVPRGIRHSAGSARKRVGL